jgi:Ca-activated chloride channel family protein
MIHKKPNVQRIFSAISFLFGAVVAQGAGILTPVNSGDQPVQMLDHHVDVQITEGFARTTIQQTFANPNPNDVEALYAFPVPDSASLSAVTIHSGETVLEGEVVTREEAERIYGEEKAQGNDVGMASKESYQRFEFRVFPIRPNVETRIEVVYYQPVNVDTGVGRYVYPIEEGGTDEKAEAFWTRNEAVERSFSANVRVHSGYPLDGMRVTGFPGDPIQVNANSWEWSFSEPGGTLNTDLVVYYRLAENLPGRVDLLSQRADETEPGYFLLTLTPGIDLAPIRTGADYLFVLDTSGSMAGKIGTLASGMEKALGELQSGDRVFDVTFSNGA